MVWNVQQRPPASIAADCPPTRLPRAAAQPRPRPPTAPTVIRPRLKPGILRACAPSFVTAGRNQPHTGQSRSRAPSLAERSRIRCLPSVLVQCTLSVMSTQTDSRMPHLHRPPDGAAAPSPGCALVAVPAAPRNRPNGGPPRAKSFLEKTLMRANPPRFRPPAAALIHSFDSAAGRPVGGLP